MIVDWQLPDGSGPELCSRLRENHVLTPILMLTGQKTDYKYRVIGLDKGADDYLTKPFQIDELKARLRALARRQPISSSTVLQVGQLQLDTSTNTVTHHGQTISLTRKEHLLLEYLMRHQGHIVSQEMILSQIWQQWGENQTNSVAVYVKFLRDKIDRPFGTQTIQTIHGYGYRLQTMKDSVA
jgi:two-component system OmpR family response regulator